MNGDIRWTPGHTGMALDFNGMDSRATAASEAILDNLSSLTFTAWINPRSDGLGDLGLILAKGGSGRQAAKRWLVNGQSCKTMHCLELTVNRSPEEGGAGSYTGVAPGKWQFVAATFDPVGGAHLYMNAAEMSYDGASSSGAGLAADDATTPYAIGAWPVSSTTGFFDGAIDEFQIYNRALTLDELHAIYLAQ